MKKQLKKFAKQEIKNTEAIKGGANIKTGRTKIKRRRSA